MIRRWAETKGSDGQPLVALQKHMINDVRLTYTETELERLNGYIADIKNNRKDHVATVIHEWRLACLSMSLAGNDSQDVGEDGDYQYRQTWGRETVHEGPAIRWLRNKFVPILLGESANGSPNQAIIFAPLPGQAWFIHWFLETFFPALKSFIFHADIPRPKRDDVIQEFSTVDSPAALVLTPALGGTGLNLVAANHLVIMQKFWVLNEQRQAIGRIDRLGQKRTPTVWLLHCKHSVDDRAEELHKLRAVYEARIMHGLIGESFSYSDLVSACQARVLEFQQLTELDRIKIFPDSPKTVGCATREQSPVSDG